MSQREEAIAALQCWIRAGRLTEETLEVLYSLLAASRDVRAVLETRSRLRSLLRSEALPALREVSSSSSSSAAAAADDDDDDEKLRVVQFFVTAFALIGDVESCLALKYEALVLRESRTVQDRQMQVTCQEWVTFAKDSLDNGFYSIAEKGFGNALRCVQPGTGVDSYSEVGTGTGTKCSDVNEIKRLRELACSLVSSHSVQTQSMRYMKRRAERVGENRNAVGLTKPKHAGSNLFRNGIKKRNAQMLLLSQSRPSDTHTLPYYPDRVELD